MIQAISLKNNVILTLPAGLPVRLERASMSSVWLVWTDAGWRADPDATVVPARVVGRFSDYDVHAGVYQYRVRRWNDVESKWDYSIWVRCGETGPVGYTFGNYKVPEGQWGEVLTPDDLHYTYLWGTDFKASNGSPYTDEQIQFHINAAVAEVCRNLNITLKKTRVASEPERRGLQPGVDYDEEEALYLYRREKVQRTGMIETRKRPVQTVSRLDFVVNNQKVTNLLDSVVLDKMKGLIRLTRRPMRMDTSSRAVMQATMPYGEEQFGGHLAYAIDYIAGYPDSDAVPADVREVIGKVAAVKLLAQIGDGLLAGFSSSSLSIDGVSESFSSTQSATSATFGARIKEYSDEIESYFTANKMKFGHWNMGAL
ncbi:hypothetical protein FACS1894172_15570 [Spirochaetia bacterium]|nr:hypothetical protein FACS1894172_15570 [Spirochaetia bacterium]